MDKTDSFFSRALVLCYCLACLLILVSASFIFSRQASAQNITATVSADDVNLIARELWCPLCSGVRLDACELKACEQMREEIAIKLQAGEDLASIKQYFFERYGEQVLGAPPRQGWGWLAWVLPPAIMVGAGVLLFLRGREWIKPTPPVAKPPPMTDKPMDRYEEKLNEELARYE